VHQCVPDIHGGAVKVDENRLSGIWFKDRVDPNDSRFRLVEMRIPMDPGLVKGGYAHAYVGLSVLHRIRRFAAGFLGGTQDITHAHAQRIVRDASARDAEVPRG
jgi:hypothetical protein